MASRARTTGRYVTSSTAGESVQAFVPSPLPPSSPAVATENLAAPLAEAESCLRELWVATDLVPDETWLIYAFVRQEAVLSSQIEGTQASLSDLLEAEAWQAEPSADVTEVTNYIRALEYARGQLRRRDGLPISQRLFKEAHQRLMQGVRGAHAQPGEFRRSQNWIGGTRPGNAVFVPPPPPEMMECLSDLERYVHEANERDRLPPLARIGLIHAQFETIHPFLDGNGRLGRLLITLLLEAWGLTRAPILYLSVYFKAFQAEYYRRLNVIRTEGDWEGWLAFFFEATSRTAKQVIALSSKLHEVWQHDQLRVPEMPKATVVAIRLMGRLPKMPIVSARLVARTLDVTFPTASKAISVLVDGGVLEPMRLHHREQFFRYAQYVDILGGGMTLADETESTLPADRRQRTSTAAKPGATKHGETSRKRKK